MFFNILQTNFDIFVNPQLSHVLLDEWKVISTSNFFTEMFLVSHSFKLVITGPQQTFFNNTVGGTVIKLSVEIFTSFEKSLNAQYQIWYVLNNMRRSKSAAQDFQLRWSPERFLALSANHSTPFCMSYCPLNAGWNEMKYIAMGKCHN